MFSATKDFLRNNKYTSLFYMKFRTIRHKTRFVTYEENKVVPVKVDDNKCRINLVLPSFYKSEVFGGISTAINFFLKLSKGLDVDCRIIISGKQKYNSKLTYKVKGFIHKNNLIFVAEDRNVDVRCSDVFICTSWITAYYFYPVIKWQSGNYHTQNRLIYLIQDYEPGFYSWSSEYVLAESTYRHSESTIAVFNSQELYEYFENHKYEFKLKCFFRPSLNETLKKILLDNQKVRLNRKKNTNLCSPSSRP